MQSKLATWSTEDKERKFDRLLRLIADRVWLSEGARITLAGLVTLAQRSSKMA